MPVVVSCQCGQRFSAKDQLFGKQVKCPSCGGPLLVPNPAAAAAAPVSRRSEVPPRKRPLHLPHRSELQRLRRRQPSPA